ncbi:major facilitator family transporter [Listeria floridensis FSL S10-1187]|uniref:Major facilitator family transporter n=1 Tax=Listeria floridensis FSL S10-1187 TaxID=1265817 RepID=A0ABN0RGX6_9LIST|nr:MFS transporter [Listeria floridensis]EUJ33170.1 major facilitator family transporter [Listeria floridensis FSL S10-1187]
MEHVQRKSNHAAFTLMALAISAFGIGSTEFISVGLLPLISSDMGISISTAGLTVSIYALGVTIGAPVFTTLTARLNRKKLLLLVMLTFIIGNLLAAFAPVFGILLVGRIVSAFAHGVFMSIASVIAADVVSPSKRASAIAVMFTGLTVATVTGVPLGTFIGQISNWRVSFLFIALIGVIALISNWLLVPKDLNQGEKTSFSGMIRVLKNGKILLILLVTALGYGGTFVIYTYLSPLLETKMGYSAHAIVIILIVYGLMVAFGNTIGGHLSNQNTLKRLSYMFLFQSIILFLLYFTSTSPILGLATVLLMGFFAFMNVPGLQFYVVKLAEENVPDAVSMASALNISAFNIGIAAGAFLGGVITEGMGLTAAPLFGGLMVLLAVFFTWLLKRIQTH